MAIGANMTQRDQALTGVGILGIVAAGLFWWFVFTPKAQALGAMSAHVDSVETMNRQARVDLTRGTAQQLQDQSAAYAHNLELMRQLVPTTNEVPALLDETSTAARRVGLDLASVEPAPVIQGDQFDTYRYKVSVMGGYHELAEFLSNVGSLDRIMAPVGLELKPHPSGGPATKQQKAGESLLDATFQLQTYVARTTPLVPGKENR